VNARVAHLRTAGAGLGIALLSQHGAALAAQWSFGPTARLQVLTETNPRLVKDGAEDVHGLVAGADLSLLRATELASLSLDASATQRRYDQASALDRLDINTALSLKARRERFSWQAAATATRDTTLTSELGLSGQTQVRSRHESASGTLAADWSASERFQVNFGASVQFDFYPGQDVALVDYRYRSANLGGSYALGPRSTLALTAQLGEMAVSGNDYKSNDSVLMLQYQFRPSERFSLAIGGGPSRAKGPGSSENGATFSASLSRIGERVRTSLSGGRRIAPTGRGYLSRRDNASLGLSVSLTEYLNGSLDASYIRSKDVLADFGLSLSDVRYRRATAGLGWQLGRSWSLGASAGYSEQLSRGTSAGGHGFDAQVGISWNGNPHVW
jgi:hypothetical protein